MKTCNNIRKYVRKPSSNEKHFSLVLLQFVFCLFLHYMILKRKTNAKISGGVCKVINGKITSIGKIFYDDL